MKRYLSTLACSGLLSIGALYGAPAFAESIPSSIPEIAPTVNAADQGSLQPAVLIHRQSDPSPVDSGSLQFVRGGGGFGGGHGGGGFGGFHGGFGGFHGGFGGFHGGFGGFHGGFGGFHGFGGFPGMGGFGGFHGMHGFRSFHGFRDGRFFHRRFFNGSGNAFFFGLGLPLLYYCNPYYATGYYGYYGACYPGYYPGY
ncbi:hypothetical protein [Mesorhizobium sp. KR1-2]|uniref:hypothetical protein n=1 Tax=Mesorhizobium sp. KR1-2 TaxID=3156609 RepID=UPI0032B38F11